MGKLFLIIFGLTIFFGMDNLFGWGSGHDHVNRLGLTILPDGIVNQLSTKMKKNVVKLSHVPDDFTPWEKWSKCGIKISPSDMEILKEYDLKHPFSLHDAKGQAVNFILLVNAFKAKSPERIALWMASLLHTHADESACNHDPLIGCMTYSFGREYKMKIGKGIGLDFHNIAIDKSNKTMINEYLKKRKPLPISKDPEEALLKVMMAGLESNAYMTRRGTTIVASYDQNPSPKTILKAKKAMAELGVYGTLRACDAIVTAWEFAKNDLTLKLTPEVKGKYRERKAEFIKKRPLSDDSLFTNLLKKQTNKKGSIGVLVEPSISLNNVKFAFSSKLLASSIIHSFLSLKIPFRFVDVRDLEKKELLSPNDMPILIVCAGKFRVSQSGKNHISNYLKDGGKLLWVGGEHKNMLGKLSSYLIETENAKLPVNLKYGKKSPIGEKVRFNFNKKFNKKLSQKEYKFIHCPNTKAGWHIPKCRYLLKKTNDKDIMVLVEMRVDKELTPIAAALLDKNKKAKIIFLPEYLVAPFLLSDEDTVSNPAELQLDKVAKEIIVSSLRLLEK